MKKLEQIRQESKEIKDKIDDTEERLRQLKNQEKKILKQDIVKKRKGNCLDNSPMENFFGILKQEVYYGNKFYSYEHLKQTIENFIKYYNEERIKEKLGYLSPVEYRKKNAA